MRLHLPAIPLTITSAAYSHCDFTGKALRFPRMMMSLGYEVYHYGVEGSESDAVNIDLLSSRSGRTCGANLMRSSTQTAR